LGVVVVVVVVEVENAGTGMAGGRTPQSQVLDIPLDRLREKDGIHLFFCVLRVVWDQAVRNS
jgi:hypothetical protein